MPGTLYLVSTPIGNLEDLSFRALKILKSVHFIAAENPQATRHLLDHYAVETPLTTYHQLNKEAQTPLILKRLLDGDHAALVSDAGTPVIADPGSYLVGNALAEGIPVVPVPGASAITTALCASGLPCDEFVFLGIFPERSAARHRLAVALREEPRTAVLFLSVKQMRTALELFHPMLGKRRVMAASNLTLANEAMCRGTSHELIQAFNGNARKGEVTLVIEGKRKKDLRQGRILAW